MADTMKNLKCPACGEVMEKFYITSQGIYLDICTHGCGGIYFDNREFDSFDEKDEDVTKILSDINNKSFKPVDESITRICPNCGAKMVKNNSSIKSIVEVDDCYSCGAKFLDHGELEKIRKEYENNQQKDEDVIRYVYKQVGKELTEVDKKYANSKIERTNLQKVFYKLIGM